MSDPALNTNEAPYPNELAAIVRCMEYRPGWRFSLQHIDRGQGSVGLTFIITSSPERGETYRVRHYFPVPPAAYVRAFWQRWVLDCLIEVMGSQA